MSESRELLRRYHEEGDLRARELFLERSLPFVRSIARRYAGRGEALEDLIQVGTIGLIKAFDRFDPKRGVQFTTYATPTVLGEIKRHFRDRTWAVRVPRRLQELIVRLPKETERLAAALGRTATLQEMAEALGVDEELLLEALEARRSYSVTTSVVSEVGDAGGEAIDLLERLGAEDEAYERSDDKLLLRAGVKELDEREQRILLLRFAQGLTQAEIASRVGYSQMHVSRILRRAVDKLAAAVGAPTPALES